MVDGNGRQSQYGSSSFNYKQSAASYGSTGYNYGSNLPARGSKTSSGQWPQHECIDEDRSVAARDWSYQQEEARVWKILKRKMVNPFRERKWTKISATAFMILLVWLWTCGHLMAWNYKPHPDQSRNWGCHYIHQLPNAVLRMFVIPFPLGALLMIVGTGRYPLTTWPNVFCCFAHIFCGFCLWFMAVADELPGIETENDEYGLKQYSLYHSIPGTAAYCVLEFARDVAAVMCIADAIVITRFYRQWMRQNAAREIDDAQRMAKIVIESVENRKNGINLNDSTQRELALFQRRQWTQKAFYKLVFLLQIIAVLSLLHIVSILFTLHEYGFHNLMLTYFGLASTRNHPYALQAPFVRDMIYTFMYFYVGTFLPLAAAQWQ